MCLMLDSIWGRTADHDYFRRVPLSWETKTIAKTVVNVLGSFTGNTVSSHGRQELLL